MREKIEEKERPDWEDAASQKSRKDRMEDKIVKQVADEILHQYKVRI